MILAGVQNIEHPLTLVIFELHLFCVECIFILLARRDSGELRCPATALIKYFSHFSLACTKYRKAIVKHPSCLHPYLRSLVTALKFYMQFLKKVSREPLIRKHLYLEHRYPGGLAFIP